MAGADSLALLEHLIPLVDHGDFGVRALLEQLIQSSGGASWQDQARAVLDAFEDLELAEARHMLSQFRGHLP